MQPPRLDDARPAVPPPRELAALVASTALPQKLQWPRHYNMLIQALLAFIRALDTDYESFVRASFLELSGDAARRAAAQQLEERLDTFAQNHASRLQGTTRCVLRGRARQISFELLIYYTCSMCALNRTVHPMKQQEAELCELRSNDFGALAYAVAVPEAPADAAPDAAAPASGTAPRSELVYERVPAHLRRVTTPVLAMNARELMQTLLQFERVFRTLVYTQDVVRYVDLLRVRAAMLLRHAFPYEAFDSDEYGVPVEPGEPGAEPAVDGDGDGAERPAKRHAGTSATRPLFRYTQRFLENAGWFFTAVDARLYTATLWPRVPRSELARTLHTLSQGRFELGERAARLRALLMRVGGTMSVELVNAKFRDSYMAHVLYLSERKRYLRAKPFVAMTPAKVIKTCRGIDTVNEMLALADTDAPVALAAATTPFANDPCAIDLMQLRVLDAYAQSFLGVKFDDLYVYYAGEVLESFARIRVARMPLFVQTFTRLELFWRAAVFEIDDFAEALAAWLAIVSLDAATRRCADGISIERLYTDAWGPERHDFSRVDTSAGVAWRPVLARGHATAV